MSKELDGKLYHFFTEFDRFSELSGKVLGNLTVSLPDLTENTSEPFATKEHSAAAPQPKRSAGFQPALSVR